MPNQPKTVAHTVRVEDELWQAACEEANRREESISAAIRRFLKRYARGPSGAVREAPVIGDHIDPHGIEFSVACERCGKVHTRAGDQQVIDGWRLRDSAGLPQ